MLERIARSQKILNDLAKKKTEVTSLCERFQQPFSRYRKKLVQNKYVLHHRIYQLSHNSQQSLVEMMSMLGNCIKTNWVEFDKVCAVVDDDIVALQTLAKRRQRTKETDYFLWEKTVAACMVEFE